MAKIEKLRCSLCGQDHGKSTASELVASGWFVSRVSRLRSSAERVICPTCLQRIYGRRLREDEFGIPADRE